MKQIVDVVDATPSKRLYNSIIADYDINKAICELVDNALDIWKIAGRSKNLTIEINLDINQQRINVVDDAGGIAAKDLQYVIAPGYSKNDQSAETIGIFGVGTKRAVVALAQEIKIRTRQNGDTFQVEFDDNWINQSTDWELAVFKVDPIPENTTQIDLIRLRKVIHPVTIMKLSYHLSVTYAIFLKDHRLSIKINNDRIQPIVFEDWAFPPSFEPRAFFGKLPIKDAKEVNVFATAGLITSSSPSSGEYGVYFYCNDRLIVKGLKSYDVGFASGLSGKPHADISLARVIICLHGEARLMPWNSSKSDINTSHDVFLALRQWLLNVVKDYTSLSRKLSKVEGGWPENVFKYKTGKMIEVNLEQFPETNASYLPPLPLVQPRYSKVVQQANQKTSIKRPWTKGLYESIIAVDYILKQSFEQKNRFALILLDSTLEIAFKEYLVNDSGVYYSNSALLSLFEKRHLVHNEIKKYIKISKANWKKIIHFYDIRCQLVHRRATDNITNSQIENYRKIVESVLKKMFKLVFPVK